MWQDSLIGTCCVAVEYSPNVTYLLIFPRICHFSSHTPFSGNYRNASDVSPQDSVPPQIASRQARATVLGKRSTILPCP